MAGSDLPDAQLDVDLLAASLRADSSDLVAYTEVLATKLTEALPGGVRVEYSRQRLFGPKQVSAITVDAGDERLALRSAHGAVQASCARLSGGIVLKTETVGIDEWLQRLSGALAEQARRSQSTRQALERLLNG